MQRTIACLVLLSLTSACSPVGEFTRLADGGRGNAVAPEEIELFYAVAPSKPHVVIGRISTRDRLTWFLSEAKSLEALKECAAEAGADGVMQVMCAPDGTVGQHRCSGSAFVWGH